MKFMTCIEPIPAIHTQHPCIRWVCITGRLYLALAQRKRMDQHVEVHVGYSGKTYVRWILLLFELRFFSMSLRKALNDTVNRDFSVLSSRAQLNTKISIRIQWYKKWRYSLVCLLSGMCEGIIESNEVLLSSQRIIKCSIFI